MTTTTFKKETSTINCILGDSTEFMKTVPDKHYTLALVDPPYGIGMGQTKTGKGWVVREKKFWDKNTPDKLYWEQLFRTTQNQIVWGGNYFSEHLPSSMGWIFWDKKQRNFSLADGELAWTSFNKALRVCELSRGKSVNANMMHGDLYHPTTKPIELYDFCLAYASQLPMTNIIDTHGGSMNSAISCWKLGYNLDIVEIDEEYYEKSIEKLTKIFNQTELF
jgi:site-specific DNA-methyltransferase (adenine-specific)